MSTFKDELSRGFKNRRQENLSDDKKREIKLSALSEIIKDVDNKKNRYIFYCPDIAVVNPLMKIIYEVALQVKRDGYNVVMLHEINGFKAKWLYDNKGYGEYKELPVEYVITKSGKKSKKQKNSYAFRVSDTLIVSDVYQDMLENILQEDALKLVQKIVLVTGYMGLSALKPGMTYDQLGVNSLIFFDDNVKKDYSELFQTKSYIADDYPLSTGFTPDNVKVNEVYPVIAITSIGNNEESQQLINVFYNRYPNLSMFTFKIIARENMDVFLENISQSAAVVMLDKNVVTKQFVYDVINMGIPVVLPMRREFADNKVIIENFVVEADVFEMADRIANFCNHWLQTSTSNIKSAMGEIAKELGIDRRDKKYFADTIGGIFFDLQKNRENTFIGLKTAVENE